MELQEFGKLSPFGLKEIEGILGLKIRSSDKIIEEVKKMVLEDPNASLISDAISKGLDSETIIVGFTRTPLKVLWNDLKRLISTIDIFSILQTLFPSVDILGFFDPDSKKVVVLLDPVVNIFGKVREKITPSIVHELCHYVANVNRSGYLSKEINNVFPFYKHLLGIAGGDEGYDISNKDLLKALEEMIKHNEELTDTTFNKIVNNTYKLWIDLISTKFNEEDAKKFSYFLFVPLLYFMGDSPDVSREVLSTAVRTYYKAYYKAYGLDVRKITAPGQEVYLCSEVTCITNQIKLNSNMINLINKEF